VRVPDAEWIPADRAGLTICDATSAAFAMPLDWAKLDAVTFSWQKVMGGEGAHGMLVLGPRAVARLEGWTPPWPLPKIFRLTHDGRLSAELFEGATINTPSMLCVEDYLDALRWAAGLGGLPALHARVAANAAALFAWVERTPWIDFLARDPATRSITSVCLRFVDSAGGALSLDEQAARADALVALLEAEGVAFDIAAYRAAPPGLRLWCGATVEAADIAILTQWLDWAFAILGAAPAQAA
jgi:phosphoserine aminotransferase